MSASIFAYSKQDRPTNLNRLEAIRGRATAASSTLGSIVYTAPTNMTLPGASAPYEARQHLEVGAFVVSSGNHVVFRAGQSIDLGPGFDVQRGAVFDASIVPVR